MGADALSAYGLSTSRLGAWLAAGGASSGRLGVPGEQALQDIRASASASTDAQAAGSGGQRAAGAALPVSQGSRKSALSSGSGSGSGKSGATGADGQALTEDQQQQVDKLKERDTTVRSHEAAHRTAAGQYGSAPTYSYQKGPDGTNYAIGGEVQIDTSAVSGNPQATIAKMEQVQRAALAPADPSSQDMHVAAEAAQAIAQAQAESVSGSSGASGSGTSGSGSGGDSGGRGKSGAGGQGSGGVDAATTTATAAAAQSGGIGPLGGRLAQGIAAYGAAAALGSSRPANTLRAVA